MSITRRKALELYVNYYPHFNHDENFLKLFGKIFNDKRFMEIVQKKRYGQCTAEEDDYYDRFLSENVPQEYINGLTIFQQVHTGFLSDPSISLTDEQQQSLEDSAGGKKRKNKRTKRNKKKKKQTKRKLRR